MYISRLFFFLEKFDELIVTYEDFSANPELLSDPKLVVKVNDRYFKWWFRL